MKSPIILTVLTLGVLALPAVAEPMVTSSSAQVSVERPLSWVVAPLDNAPRDLMFLGLAKVPANEGVLDRTIRVIAGAGLIAGAATQPSWPQAGTIAAYAGGGILAFTGADGFCPLYLPFGINTRF